MREPDVESRIKAWQKEPEDKTVLQGILKEVEPTVNNILTSYAPGKQDALKIKAMSMTTDALKKFDPTKQVPIKNYLFQQLQPLRREYGKRLHTLKVPESRILDRNRLQKAEVALVEKMQRDPTVEELADATGISVKRIEKARRAGMPVPESRVETEKGDIPLSEQRDPLEIWTDFVYHDLDSRDKKIFEWASGYRGTKQIPKIEIAKQLRISPSTVSQRISQITAKLQEMPRV